MLFCYRSGWGVVFFPFVWLFQFWEQKQIQKGRDEMMLQEEFLHGIGILNGALQAGLSMENSWKEVERETRLLYGETSKFYNEIKEMNQRVAHNAPIEKLFLEFAYRSKQEDIIQFAELFEFGKRSGSNWKKIIEATVNQMTERQEARKQIEVMVAEKKMEQQIMTIMPLGLLVFLQVSAWDYMDVLYHNWLGVIIMTIFLIGYVVAIIFAQRILKVNL